MKRDGFSLIELLVVMVILGIVASLGTVSFTGWVRKHDLESQVKEMYTDLMSARLTAMHQNKTHFITLSANQLRAYEDTSPAPNGDGTLTIGSDGSLCMWERKRGEPADATCTGNASLSFKNLTFPITWNGSSTTLEFNPRGLYNSTIQKTVCVFSTYNTSYNCIIVSQTRISMGKLNNNQSGVCSSGTNGNCQPKK